MPVTIEISEVKREDIQANRQGAEGVLDTMNAALRDTFRDVELTAYRDTLNRADGTNDPTDITIGDLISQAGSDRAEITRIKQTIANSAISSLTDAEKIDLLIVAVRDLAETNRSLMTRQRNLGFMMRETLRVMNALNALLGTLRTTHAWALRQWRRAA